MQSRFEAAAAEPNFFEYITDFLLIRMPPAPVRTGLILGAGAVSGVVALEAAALYQKGLFQDVIITGGIKPCEAEYASALLPVLEAAGVPRPEAYETEADYMARIMDDRGVPARAMRVDAASMNTYANIVNAMPLGLDRTPSVMAVTLAYHQRRAIGTIRAQRPFKEDCSDRLAITTHGVYPLGITRENWMDHDLARDIILAERVKLQEYQKKGDCVPVNLGHEIPRLRYMPASRDDPRTGIDIYRIPPKPECS